MDVETAVFLQISK